MTVYGYYKEPYGSGYIITISIGSIRVDIMFNSNKAKEVNKLFDEIKKYISQEKDFSVNYDNIEFGFNSNLYVFTIKYNDINISIKFDSEYDFNFRYNPEKILTSEEKELKYMLEGISISEEYDYIKRKNIIIVTISSGNAAIKVRHYGKIEDVKYGEGYPLEQFEEAAIQEIDVSTYIGNVKISYSPEEQMLHIGTDRIIASLDIYYTEDLRIK